MSEFWFVIKPWMATTFGLAAALAVWRCLVWRNRARAVRCTAYFPSAMDELVRRRCEARRNRWALVAATNALGTLGVLYPWALIGLLALGLALVIDVAQVPWAYVQRRRRTD